MSGDFGYSKAQSKAIKREPSITEANVTYFAVVIISSLILNLAYLFKNLHYSVSIALAVVLMLSNLAFIIFANLKKTSTRDSRTMYYLSFLCAAFSFCFSLAAVFSKMQTFSFSMNNIYILTAMAALALVDLFFLATGVMERFYMILMSIALLAAVIVSCAIWANDSVLGAPLFFASFSCFVLHLAMTVYVMSGESFFTSIAAAYFIIILIGLLVALAVAGSGDCSCDCSPDCSLRRGGRRQKLNRHLEDKFINKL